MKLAVDLHSHTNLDPVDGISRGGSVAYSYQDALIAAKRAGIGVLSFTHHKKLIFTKKMVADAKKQGIVLISGVEAVVEGCDVLLINTTTDNITTFAQLRAERMKNKQLLVIAPHPFYPGAQSLGFHLLRHIDLFDAIEYCHFHTWWCNVPNWLAVLIARKYSKSIIGTSDSHRLSGFGLTYGVVDATQATVPAIVHSLKIPRNVSLVTKHISFSYACSVAYSLLRSLFLRKNVR